MTACRHTHKTNTKNAALKMKWSEAGSIDAKQKNETKFYTHQTFFSSLVCRIRKEYLSDSQGDSSLVYMYIAVERWYCLFICSYALLPRVECPQNIHTTKECAVILYVALCAIYAFSYLYPSQSQCVCGLFHHFFAYILKPY